MSSTVTEGQINGIAKSCQNCGHRTCMFHGEERRPVYGDRCWFGQCWVTITGPNGLTEAGRDQAHDGFEVIAGEHILKQAEKA